MSKKHTILYVAKVNSKPAKAKTPITIPAGQMLTLRLHVGQSEGWVNEVAVKQVGGTNVAFTLELLDSEVPYFAGGTIVGDQSTQGTAVAATSPVELYRVLDGQKSATAGNAVVVQSPEFGFPYINADQVSQTENRPYLYLTIVPTAAGGDTVWALSVTTTRDVF